MKKFKIRTYLTTGIVMALLSITMLIVMPSQVRLPRFDSGAPSPRIIPGICLVGILILSAVLIIESLIFKKEKIYEFDWEKEKTELTLIAMLLAFVGLTMLIGFIAAGIIIFCGVMFYSGERKPFIYIFTIAAVIAVYYLFINVFNVSLPGFEGFGG